MPRKLDLDNKVAKGGKLSKKCNLLTRLRLRGTLLAIAKRQNESNCLSPDEGIEKICYLCTLAWYLVPSKKSRINHIYKKMDGMAEHQVK